MIEKKIKEVENYFIDKVVDGDYEFVNCNDLTAEVRIDNKYLVGLWIPSGVEHFCIMNNITPSEKSIEFSNETRKKVAYKKIMEHINNYNKKILKIEKQKQIEKLKRELERMES